MRCDAFEGSGSSISIRNQLNKLIFCYYDQDLKFLGEGEKGHEKKIQ